jgi:hypothetical protein
MPSFSFKDLKASRPLMMVVYGSLAVIGTAESVFWFKVAKAKFYREAEEGTVVED